MAAVIRQQQSSYLNFMNPFPSSLQVNIRIETEHEQGIFTLMVKRTRIVTVAPFSSLQVRTVAVRLVRRHTCTVALIH